MLSYWKRSLPIRNTVLTIGIAILLRVGWHLIWGTPDSAILSIKSVIACLVIGWAIVDFFGLGTVLFFRKHVAEEVPGGNQKPQR